VQLPVGLLLEVLKSSLNTTLRWLTSASSCCSIESATGGAAVAAARAVGGVPGAAEVALLDCGWVAEALVRGLMGDTLVSGIRTSFITSGDKFLFNT